MRGPAGLSGPFSRDQRSGIEAAGGLRWTRSTWTDSVKTERVSGHKRARSPADMVREPAIGAGHEQTEHKIRGALSLAAVKQCVCWLQATGRFAPNLRSSACHVVCDSILYL